MVALYGFLAEERRKDAWMLERRLIECLARHIGCEVRLETSADSGDWFALVLPQVKGVES